MKDKGRGSERKTKGGVRKERRREGFGKKDDGRGSERKTYIPRNSGKAHGHTSLIGHLHCIATDGPQNPKAVAHALLFHSHGAHGRSGLSLVVEGLIQILQASVENHMVNKLRM